jgi:hypothetical protein
MVVVFALIILGLLILPALAAAKHKSAKIHCANNLMQLAMAFRIWEGDHNDRYLMDVSATNSPANQ